MFSFTKALRTVCLESTDGADLFMAVGKVDEILVENARFDPAARHVCLSSVGRAIDAMIVPFNRPQYDCKRLKVCREKLIPIVTTSYSRGKSRGIEETALKYEPLIGGVTCSPKSSFERVDPISEQRRASIHQFNSQTIHHSCHGVPAVSSQPQPRSAQSISPRCVRTEERLRDSCQHQQWRQDGEHNSIQRSNCMCSHWPCYCSLID